MSEPEEPASPGTGTEEDTAANANPGHVAAVEADGNTVANEAPGVSSSGSRPPAQMHGTLDGSGSGSTNAEEEQEIQKIISEIHGTGDDSEDDGPPSRRSGGGRSSSGAAADGFGPAAASRLVPAIPAGLMTAQPVTDDDLVMYESHASHRSSHAAAELMPAAAAEADADAAEQEQQLDAQEAEAHGAR
ncbi:hypothetical protein OEZ86_003809 [Tetradesmus obliquus]|nr:hypothetical protein OEZ86_003809 [Tetradesmus obliquus]